ncbi:hypothetical protein DFH08DRAFT_1021012 [Mycena albidolilacea]|uniref:Uncharacterized protein n=1 Tax=Mycena albidolilacea TaxID=1033008 RepID=A0AAD7EJX6_9AGAR|nr:hypothetical protein DFH08DRAFT_1021012 [Mycena albidolilacea]
MANIRDEYSSSVFSSAPPSSILEDDDWSSRIHQQFSAGGSSSGSRPVSAAPSSAYSDAGGDRPVIFTHFFGVSCSLPPPSPSSVSAEIEQWDGTNWATADLPFRTWMDARLGWDFKPSNVKWLDPDVSSEVAEFPQGIRLTEKNKIHAFHRVTGCPSQFPFFRQRTGFLINLTDVKGMNPDREITVDQLIRNQVIFFSFSANTKPLTYASPRTLTPGVGAPWLEKNPMHLPGSFFGLSSDIKIACRRAAPDCGGVTACESLDPAFLKGERRELDPEDNRSLAAATLGTREINVKCRTTLKLRWRRGIRTDGTRCFTIRVPFFYAPNVARRSLLARFIRRCDTCHGRTNAAAMEQAAGRSCPVCDTVGAAPDSSAATLPHLGHSYAPHPIPTPPRYRSSGIMLEWISSHIAAQCVAHPRRRTRTSTARPSCFPVALPFPSIAEGGLQGGSHCNPARYALPSPPSRRAVGLQGGVGAAISALAPHLPTLAQKRSTPVDVNRESNCSPALLAASIRPHRVRQRFGVALIRTVPPPEVAQQRWYRDKPLPQVHGALDGALAAAQVRCAPTSAARADYGSAPAAPTNHSFARSAPRACRRLAPRHEGRRTVDDRVGNSNKSNWWGMYAANGEEIAEGQHQTMLLATLDAPGVPNSPNFAPSSESLQDLTPKIIGLQMALF